MELTIIIGWVGAVASTVIGIPQMMRLFRTRDAKGLSVFFWQLKFCIDVIWTVHGFVLRQMNMIVPNGLSLAITLAVLWMLHTAHKRSYLLLLVPGAVLAAGMVAIDIWVGSAWFGIVASIPAVIGNGGQSIGLIRSRKITGISPAFLVAYNINQALWTTWAFMVNDDGTKITSLATWVLVAFNLLWWVARQLGLQAIFPITDADEEPEEDDSQSRIAASLASDDKEVLLVGMQPVGDELNDDIS